MRRCWLMVVLLVAVSSARAQNQGRTPYLAATVFDPSGASVPNATVTLKRGAKVLASVKTDSSGRFRFEAIPPGNYSIRLSKRASSPR